MNYIGIDVASQTHVVAMVSATEEVLLKPTSFTEDAAGYQQLWDLLGPAAQALVVLEATGHYWRNLVAALLCKGFQVAVVNPLRTRRAAEADLPRTKTDQVDALQLARFAAQKKPKALEVPDQLTEELRELVHLRERLVQDFGDRVRQLHRLVDLCFPEFTKYVKDLRTELASSLLQECPTASCFAQAKPWLLARLKYDGRHQVGRELAKTLVETAKQSVGAHQAEVYQLQVRYYCEDLDVLRKRIKQLEHDLEQKLEGHKVGHLLTTIDGIGPLTAARVIAEVGNPARFDSPKALAAYAGVVPGLKKSGLKQGDKAALCPLGHARLRAALWMPTLKATQNNPWLRDYYLRLLARGKHHKVAMVACMRKLLGAIYSVSKHLQPFVLPEEVPS